MHVVGMVQGLQADAKNLSQIEQSLQHIKPNMNQLTHSGRCGAALTHRRPHRVPLQVFSLHKALRKPSSGPITAPADVVHECLTLLRRPDLESLVPFFPSFDPAARRVAVSVGGEEVEEAGPLACCAGFMDTAARRVLPGHLLRRCRVLSSWVQGDSCQQRVALTACSGEEAVFVWRLRRAASAGDGGASTSSGSSSSGSSGASSGTSNGTSNGTSSSNAASGQSYGSGSGRPDAVAAVASASSSPPLPSSSTPSPPPPKGLATPSTATTSGAQATSPPMAAATAAAATASRAHPLESDNTPSPSLPRPQHLPSSVSGSDDPGSIGSESSPESEPGSAAATTAWIVECISRDDSYDDEELPYSDGAPPGPAGFSSSGGGGPLHPRCSPELVVKAQLAALRRGDVMSAATYNLWSRSTLAGWDLHLSAFRSLLRQPPYQALLTAKGGVELRASALPTSRRMLQEVELLGSGSSRQAEAPLRLVYQLGMQANGCWVVEAIRAV